MLGGGDVGGLVIVLVLALFDVNTCTRARRNRSSFNFGLNCGFGSINGTAVNVSCHCYMASTFHLAPSVARLMGGSKLDT